MIRYAILLLPGHTPFNNSGSTRIPIVADTVRAARKRLRARGIMIARVWSHTVTSGDDSTIFCELKGSRAPP